jgi:hypothetical protein
MEHSATDAGAFGPLTESGYLVFASALTTIDSLTKEF